MSLSRPGTCAKKTEASTVRKERVTFRFNLSALAFNAEKKAKESAIPVVKETEVIAALSLSLSALKLALEEADERKEEDKKEEAVLDQTVGIITCFLHEEAGVNLPWCEKYTDLLSKGVVLSAAELQQVYRYCCLVKQAIDASSGIAVESRELMLQCVLFVSFVTLSQACRLGRSEKEDVLKMFPSVKSYLMCRDRVALLLRAPLTSLPREQQRLQKLFRDINTEVLAREESIRAAFAKREAVFLAKRVSRSF